MKTPKASTILFLISASTLLGSLSASMVNLVLPALGQAFAIPLEQSRWILQLYLLTTTVLLLPGGRLGDLLGHRRIFLGGFALFAGASLLCGLAHQSFAWFLVGRVLQAAGASLTMASGPALLTLTFPPEQRGRALGVVGTATYMGLTFGPPIGGFLFTHLGWPWVFLINVPISAVLLALGALLLPGPSEKTPGTKKRGLDGLSLLALTVGLPLLLSALSKHPPASPALLAPLGIAVLVGFGVRQRYAESPLLDLALFKSRIFAGATLSALGNYIAMFVVILLLPFYLADGLGKRPDEAGLWMSVQPLVMAMVAAPAGRLSDKLGSRLLATVGLSVQALALLLLSFTGPETPSAVVLSALALIGFGTGVFISPNSSALMGAAPRAQQGVASSVLGLSRNLGMLLGVTLGAGLFSLLGGHADQRWTLLDYQAFDLSLRVAAGIALVGAVMASLRGREATSPPAPQVERPQP